MGDVVNSKNNYWGTSDPKEISAKIYDNRQDSRLRKVLFELFLKE